MQWFADLVKWLLIIIAAAIAFYCVYPKYYFPSLFVRCNKMTGKVEIYRNHKWEPLKSEDGFAKWQKENVEHRWQEAPIIVPSQQSQ